MNLDELQQTEDVLKSKHSRSRTWEGEEPDGSWRRKDLRGHAMYSGFQIHMEDNRGPRENKWPGMAKV